MKEGVGVGHTPPLPTSPTRREGFLSLQMFADAFKNSFQIVSDFVVPEPQYCNTDSVCSVNKLEQNQFANSTPGTRFSPSRFARIEPFCQRFNRSPYKTVSTKFGIAHTVSFTVQVLRTVQFNNQTGWLANEIYDVLPNDFLPPETHAKPSAFQLAPEQSFFRSHVLPQSSRYTCTNAGSRRTVSHKRMYRFFPSPLVWDSYEPLAEGRGGGACDQRQSLTRGFPHV